MICPTGCLAKFVSSPLAKNFFAFRFGRNRNRANHPVPLRGALRERHGRRARDAMDAAARETGDADADVEVVWS